MEFASQYETIIGLEIHLQLSTKSKAFCGDDTRFGGTPNSQVSPVSLGHPGTLPKLNEKQLVYAMKLGLALGCTINSVSYFDRKNYFYTDLPKGYQITQDRYPICRGGALRIKVNESERIVRLHHIHMEEDAGKSIHDIDPAYSLIDLNRAGVPLLEIVTEPDLRSSAEVDIFMTKIRQLAKYLEISDGNMQEGSMRCDVNVSVRRKGELELGERCEIKNVNSMKFARQAIDYEVHRQIKLIEKGENITRETLNFNPVTGTTTPMRDKESAHDYRYFPDPDLPPIHLSNDYIERIRTTLPALPWELHEKLMKQFGLSAYEADLISDEKITAEFFLKLVQYTKSYKAAANLIINKIAPYLDESSLSFDDFPVKSFQLAAFIELIEKGKVSTSAAYQRLFPELIEQPETDILMLAQKLNLIQTSDSEFLIKIIDEVIAQNPSKVEEYRKGRKGLLGFFMGEVMRASRGKAEPKATTDLLKHKLEN